MLTDILYFSALAWLNDTVSRTITSIIIGNDQLPEDMQQLLVELPYMHQLIDQAESAIGSIQVENLLPHLKDAVYDAEDLIDEFDYYELMAETEKNTLAGRLYCWARRNYINNSAINGKLEVVRRRVYHIVDHIKDNLYKRSGRLTRKETTSFQAEHNIFGREAETYQLINLLCTSNRKREAGKRKAGDLDKERGKRSVTVSVLPIVGLGGVGKTTLAQRIYNDETVISYFGMRIWACASNDLSMMSLTKKILHSLGKETHIDDLQYLLSNLAEEVCRQRFLLVIDDLWDDVLNDDSSQTWWRYFTSMETADGMILVTTRSSKVADTVCTIQPFPLLGFRYDVFCDFFNICIFGSVNSQNNTDNYVELDSIGKKIAYKLNGSALAAKTIGFSLRMKLDTKHWTSILKTELSDIRQGETDILPTLRFSYMHLPSHLKRCFSFCAVYPKGYEIHRPTLVDIWVAEGFVEPQVAMPITSIGNQYFEDLVSRSLLEKASNSSDIYIIDDLIHDMINLVAKNECFVIKDSADFHKVPPNVRHLSIQTSKHVNHLMLRSICKYKKLRSLLCLTSSRDIDIVSIIGTWFNELPRIRVFYISARFSKLPFSIGNLKHLRYLKFSRAEFMELPSSFYRLHKMQFLHAPISNINDFAKNINKLPNLYKFQSNTLWLDEDKIILDAAEDHGRGIQMLKYLRHFQGSLIVHNIGMVRNIADVVAAELSKMMYVETLYLCWSWMHYYETEQQQHAQNSWIDKDVLESLRPPINVKFLRISNYRGQYIPIWLQSSDVLPELASLEFLCCGQLENISLKHRNLTSITIKVCNGLSRLEVLTPEYFNHINKICVEQCQHLNYLPSERFGGFHSLMELYIVACPGLKWSRNSVLPRSLRKLYLAICGDISEWIASCLLTLTLLTDLSLVGCMWLTYIPSNIWSKLTALENLEIQDCEDLISIGGSEAIAHIKNVYIYGCPKLDGVTQPILREKRKIRKTEPPMQDYVQNLPNSRLVLQKALFRIKAFIKLAEWSIHRDKVVKFIQEARDAMYHTEDLLDELKCYDLQVLINGGKIPFTLSQNVRHSEDVSFKLEVEQIQKKVAHLTILMNVLELHDDQQLYINDSIESNKPHSFSENHKLFGRGEELKKLINSLCSTSAGHDNNQTMTGNVSILAIVGCGGVGKTTLAQHVFSNRHVQSYFDIAIWVTVSEDLAEKNLIKKFIRSVAETEMKSDDLASAQRILTNGIIDGSKRFLFILDNVQKETVGEGKDDFDSVIKLLEHAKEGSKILVTTRSLEVADAIGAGYHLLLMGFPKETLLAFFNICAFGSYKSNDLVSYDVHRSIAAKLGTSPLAVEVIGRALSFNIHTEYWRLILKSGLWDLSQDRVDDDCLSALLLAYCCLPFNLRRCFSFCSIYPKGYEFDKGSLVDCWTALGLVECDGDIVQDAGNLCFQQLLSRAFFQKAASSSKYVLPGLLHDVARHVSENECYVIKDRSDLQKVPLNVRHLSILGQGGLRSNDLCYLSSRNKLLSLVFYDVEPTILTPVMNTLFSESTKIRMLSFTSCHMKELPESIGNLKFLRYLDISSCTFDRFPASFWCLHNLEILDARNCSLKELPNNITNFRNLRKFILRDTDHIGPFRDIPGVGKLVFLQEMPCFAVDGRHGRAIGELKHMNFLHGKLEISGLINVRSKDEAADAELHNKVRLDTLILSWDKSVSACNKKQPFGTGKEVLEGLCPNSNLQHLEIRHYMDFEVRPSWFHNGKLRNLKSLTLDSCPNVTKLSFQAADGSSSESTIGFPVLTKLSLSRCRRLYSLEKFLQPQFLPVLKTIKIEKCDEVLSLPTENFGGFVHLEELDLRQCWNLNWGGGLVLPQLLKELKLEACGDISESTLRCLHNLVPLTTFQLQFCHQVESIPPEIWKRLQYLQNLVIFYCKGLKSIGGSKAIAQIKNVNIAECPQLQDPKQPFRVGTFVQSHFQSSLESAVNQ